MKNFTYMITDHKINDGVERHLMTFILHRSGSAKLITVKCIKDVFGVGLKDARDFVVESDKTPSMFKKNMSLPEINRLNEILTNSDSLYELHGMESIRNKKLILLGICDKSDYIEELVHQSINFLYFGCFFIIIFYKIYLVLRYFFTHKFFY